MKLKKNMKMRLGRKAAWSLVAVLTLSLVVSGCANEDKDDKKDNAKETTEIEAIEVSSTEELLDAIAPDAHIVIKKGTYNLTEDIEDMVGDNYSKFNKKHDYVQLEECFDGMQIVIEGVEGLTISGQDGKKIELQVEPRYADVLTFRECSDIALENLTIGHTVEQGYCEGEVLQFEDSENITLTDLDLYGCGTYGICSMKSEGITMSDSIIRDCSYGIVDISSSDASFKSCEFTGCEGFNLIEVSSSDLTFSKCTFDGNTGSGEFITYYNNGKNSIAFKACTFGESESLCIANETDSYGDSVSFDSKCSFADVSASSGNGGVTSVDINGRIDTAGEILEAIEPGANVSIEPGYYNLTEFAETVDVQGWNDEHEYVKIYQASDGYEVHIVHVSDLKIHSSTNDCFDVEIVVESDDADVFAFEVVTGLTLDDITLGHAETNQGAGNIISFSNCSDISLGTVTLQGCGGSGIYTDYTGDMYIDDIYITDCINGPFNINYANGPITFYYCEFSDSWNTGYISPSRYDVEFSAVNFGACESSIYYSRFATFEDCSFGGTKPYPDRPENLIGYHEDVDGLEPMTYTEFCDSYRYYDDLFFEAFEVIKDRDDIMLPVYESDDDVDGIFVMLALLNDGTGYIKDASGLDPVRFIWEESADGSCIVMDDDPDDDLANFMKNGSIYFYTDATGYNIYIELVLDDGSFWLANY